MGLHHATLKAAVLVYAALIGTMTEEALKAEIAKDEKAFTPEEVDEVYAAVVKSTSDASSSVQTKDQKTTELNFKEGGLVSQDPPVWVAEVLASNLKTQESNQTVIDAISQFKDLAGNLVKEIVEGAKSAVAAESVQVTGVAPITVNVNSFDPDATYEVVSPFRDSKDFTKLHKIGDDVTYLGEERIKHLLGTGNVEEA